MFVYFTVVRRFHRWPAVLYSASNGKFKTTNKFIYSSPLQERRILRQRNFPGQFRDEQGEEQHDEEGRAEKRFWSERPSGFSGDSAQKELPVIRSPIVNPSNDDNDVFLSEDVMEIESEQQELAEKRRQRSFRHLANRPPNVAGEILFGLSPVTLALGEGRRQFFRIFLKHENAYRLNSNPRLQELDKRARDLGIQVTRVGISALDELSGGRPHQGVCADVTGLQFETQRADIGSVTASLIELGDENDDDTSQDRLWVLVDKVQDPMNLGAILRSSYYFGVDRVITVQRDCCGLTPVVSKASSGAMEIMKVYKTKNPIQLLEARISQGWTVIGTASGDAVEQVEKDKIIRLSDMQWQNKTIILIGNEGYGISPRLMQFSKQIVTIDSLKEIHPLMNSLNVAVATGIILHACSSGMPSRV